MNWMKVSKKLGGDTKSRDKRLNDQPVSKMGRTDTEKTEERTKV